MYNVKEIKKEDFGIKKMTQEDFDNIMTEKLGVVGIIDDFDRVPDRSIEPYHICGWGFVWIKEKEGFNESYILKLRPRGTWTWKIYKNTLVKHYEETFGISTAVANDLFNGGNGIRHGKCMDVLEWALKLQHHEGWYEFRIKTAHKWKHLWGIDNNLSRDQMKAVKVIVDYLNLREQRRQEWKEV